MPREFKQWFKGGAVKVYRRFLKLRGEPHAIAMGLALGVFIGMSPLMGLHSVIAVTAAAIFKWSKVAALIGVFVTNPLTAPAIYPLTYALGAAILGRPMTLATSGGLNLGDIFHSSPHVLTNLFVGGGILGLAGGAISYAIALRAIRQYRRRRQLRAEGDVPFAAVRKRLMRVARRQRRKAQRRTKHKSANGGHLRRTRRSRRRGHGPWPAGTLLVRPIRLRRRAGISSRRTIVWRKASVSFGRMP